MTLTLDERWYFTMPFRSSSFVNRTTEFSAIFSTKSMVELTVIIQESHMQVYPGMTYIPSSTSRQCARVYECSALVIKVHILELLRGLMHV